MIGSGVIQKDTMPSFLLECVVWNIHDMHFGQSTYREKMKVVISKIWQDMNDYEKHNKYAEVSDLKWLFRGDKWTPQQVKTFMENTYNLFGF